MNGEDSKLFKEVLSGDGHAFRKFFWEYWPKMFRFCLEFFHDEALAKDIVQDSFVILWENLGSVRSEEALPAYLFKVLKNRCLKEVRTRAIMDRFSSFDSYRLSEMELSGWPDGSDVLGELFSKELDSTYRKALGKLPEKCREILTLSREEGLPYREIPRSSTSPSARLRMRSTADSRNSGDTWRSTFPCSSC